MEYAMWVNKFWDCLIGIYRCLKVGVLLGLGFMVGVVLILLILLVGWILFALYLFS